MFFDVTKDKEYGKLTNRTIDSLQGEGGGAAAKKHSTADFALWKRAKDGRTELAQSLGRRSTRMAH